MKKIKQWFVGLILAIFGTMVCTLGVGVVLSFINMINTTGREFVGYFLAFIFGLALFLILPYIFFKMIEDGVQDELK